MEGEGDEDQSYRFNSRRRCDGRGNNRAHAATDRECNFRSRAEQHSLSFHGLTFIFPSGAQTFTNTGIAYSSTVSNGIAKNFFVNNSGTFTTSGFAMIILLPSNSNVSAFKRCNINVAFTGTGTCASGSATTVAITPGSATTYSLPIAPNSFYAFQIVQNKSGSIQVNTYANSSFISYGVSHS